MYCALIKPEESSYRGIIEATETALQEFKNYKIIIEPINILRRELLASTYGLRRCKSMYNVS